VARMTLVGVMQAIQQMLAEIVAQEQRPPFVPPEPSARPPVTIRHFLHSGRMEMWDGSEWVPADVVPRGFGTDATGFFVDERTGPLCEGRPQPESVASPEARRYHKERGM
jgi:hypothetical protein